MSRERGETFVPGTKSLLALGRRGQFGGKTCREDERAPDVRHMNKGLMEPTLGRTPCLLRGTVGVEKEG